MRHVSNSYDWDTEFNRGITAAMFVAFIVMVLLRVAVARLWAKNKV